MRTASTIKLALATSLALVAVWAFVAYLGLTVSVSADLGGGSWYVANSGSNTPDCGSLGSPCMTIDYAISKTGTAVGATVVISPGSYTLTVALNKPITLTGAVRGEASINSTSGVTITASDVTISGIAIIGEGSSVGITVTTESTHVMILNNQVYGYNTGVQFNRGNSHLLQGNVITGNSVGLAVEGDLVIEVYSNTIRDNTVAGVLCAGPGPLTATLGGSQEKANTFSNTVNISVTLPPSANTSIIATYNNWEATDLQTIEDRIYHQADDPSRAQVRYFGVSITATPPVLLADGISTSTITGTLTGLANPQGNTISFTTSSATLGAPSGSAGTQGEVITTITTTTSGAKYITAMAGTTYIQSDSVILMAQALDHFAFSPIGSSQVAGVGFTTVITAQDSNNGTVTSFNSNLTLTDQTRTVAPSNIFFNGGVWSGVVTITGAYVNDIMTVTHTQSGATGASNSFTVTANALDHITLSPASRTITAGQSLTYTVTAYDAYTNTREVTSSETYTITPAAQGSWTGNIYTSEIAGTWTVTATYGNPGSDKSAIATLTVTHDWATSLSMEPQSKTIRQGERVTYHVVATDTLTNSWDATSDATYTITLGASGYWLGNVYTSAAKGTWVVTATVNTRPVTATLMVIPYSIYLPAVLRNYTPFTNGDFENGWSGWQHGAGPFNGHGIGLPQQVITFAGSYLASLGSPTYDDKNGHIPVGKAYMSQYFSLPYDKKFLTLSYRVHSFDAVYVNGQYFDTFEVSIYKGSPPQQDIQDSERESKGCRGGNLNPQSGRVITPTVDGLVFCAGAPALTPTGWDSHWQTVILDLRDFAGSNVTLYFANWNREYDDPFYNDQGFFNTYTYVDNVQLLTNP